ncbi:hypothetical protein [Labrys neptuniae]
MNYVTIFDAANNPIRNWTFFAPGFLFVAVTAIMVFKPDILAGVKIRGLTQYGPRMRWFCFLFASAVTVFAMVSIIGGNISAMMALRAGRCNVVEGKVEDFKPMPYGGHTSESFSVAGTRFSYSDFVITSGFNNTASHGGPIREGVPVRICARGGDILRLEIAPRQGAG